MSLTLRPGADFHLVSMVSRDAIVTIPFQRCPSRFVFAILVVIKVDYRDAFEQQQLFRIRIIVAFFAEVNGIRRGCRSR
jgi:hypothetical protein